MRASEIGADQANTGIKPPGQSAVASQATRFACQFDEHDLRDILGGGGILWVLPMILTLVGAILVMRPTAQEWFLSEAKP